MSCAHRPYYASTWSSLSNSIECRNVIGISLAFKDQYAHHKSNTSDNKRDRPSSISHVELPPTPKNHANVKGVPTLKDMTPIGTWYIPPIGNNPRIVMGAS